MRGRNSTRGGNQAPLNPLKATDPMPSVLRATDERRLTLNADPFRDRQELRAEYRGRLQQSTNFRFTDSRLDSR